MGHGPPRRSTWQRFRFRVYTERKTFLLAMSDVSRWFLRWGLGVLLLVTMSFVLAAWRLGSAWVAYDVLVGITAPDDKKITATYTALALSALGWILVPAFVGAAAGLIVERQVESHRRNPTDDLTARRADKEKK